MAYLLVFKAYGFDNVLNRGEQDALLLNMNYIYEVLNMSVIIVEQYLLTALPICKIKVRTAQ